MILYICFVSFFVPLAALERTLTLINPPKTNHKFQLSPRFAHRIHKRSTDVTAAQQQALLDAHNQARSEVSPTATNMKILKWDDTLATSAQSWADGCLWQHSTSADRPNSFSSVGENLAVQASSGSLASFDISRLVRTDETNVFNWVNEKFNYTYSDTICPADDVCGTCDSGAQCGHYTQVVWASSEYVGCGINYECGNAPFGFSNSFPNTAYLVCQYAPSGNFIGQPPYEQGTSCSNCPSNHPICIDNLCTEVACPTAPTVANADVTGSGNSVNDIRTYSCQSGFTLSGSDTITCQNDGTWTTPPTCTAVTCPTAPTVANADVTGSGNSVNDIRTYSCQSGFALSGSDTITCQNDGTWTTPPTCTAVTCPAAPTVANADVTGSGNSVNDIRTYSCQSGFTLSGSDTITCQNDGTWTTPPTCIAVTCPTAPTVANADVTGSGNSVNDIRTYSCQSGFTLSGSDTITCQNDGTWTTPPTCIAVTCPTAPTVANADVTGSGNSVNDIRTYSCQSGFTLSGSDTITCQNDGTWTTPPTCTAVTCPTAPTVANADVTGSGNSVNDIRTYSCQSGFTLSGSDTITCQNDGTWTTPPTCTAVTCPTAPTVANADVTGSGNSVNDIRTYSCQSGFALSGSDTITCQNDGTWTTPPTCTAVTCPAAPTVANADVTGSGNSVNDIRTYSCQSGFTLSGSDTITCQNDGTWSTHPTCTAVTCPTAPTVANADVTGSGNSVNDVRTYSCQSGFTLSGSDTITCQNDGTWTTPPTCIAVTCPTAPTVANADVTGSGNSVNDIRTYSCQSGFTLSGSDTITCQNDGTWTAPPTCTAVTCPTAPTVANADVTGSGNSVNDIRTYSCQSGFTLSGSDTITCQNDGTWTTPPTCTATAVTCPTAPTVANADVTGSGNSVNDIRTYSCQSGFTLSGSDTITCQNDGTWTTPPTCTAVTCPTAPTVANADVTGSGNSVNDIRTYSCQSGFILSGSDTITCQNDGTWTTPPTCTAVTCPTAPTVANADVTGSGNSVNDIRTYSCQSGFTLSGSDTITCQNDGTWTTPPTCTEVTCPTAPTVANADVTGSGNSVNDVRTYSCQSGFTLSGSDTITCQNDGSWTTPPTCTAVTCPTAPTVANADVTGSGNSVNDIRTYSCQSGFTLSGSDTITCQNDGTWTTPPTCTEVTCPTAPTVANADVTGSGNSVNDIRTYSCQSGFTLSGSDTITCQNDGTWTTPPTCTAVTCPTAPTVANADVTGSGNSVNDIRTYSCQSGFTLSGSDTVTCQNDGTWTTPPTCTAVTCPTAPTVANADVTGSGNSVNDIRTYSCQSGFTLSGSDNITCQNDGTWTTPPTCTAVTCPTAPTVGNADVTGGEKSLNDIRTYSCQSGFTLSGSDIITCENDGTWTTPPTCTAYNTAIQAAMACSFEADDDICTMGECDTSGSVNFSNHTGTTDPDECYDGENCMVMQLSEIRRRRRDYGCLVSDVLPDGAKCVSLAYYMFGSGSGTLFVYGSADEGIFNILRVTGSQGDEWQTVTVEVPPGTNEKIWVIARRSSPRSTNTISVSVDDLEVLEGTCPCSRIPCANNGTCAADGTCQCVGGYIGPRCQDEGCEINPCENGGTCGGDGICQCVAGYSGQQCELIDHTVSCGFETDFCEWEQVTDDDMDWTRLSDSTPTWFTGPSEAAEGSTYAYVEATDQSQGDIATLETPFEFAGGDRCISLQLHMRGYWGQMGIFKILVGNDDTWEVAYADVGHQGTDWYDVQVTRNLEGKKVRLCAIRGSGWMSDIAIDDVEISPGAC